MQLIELVNVSAQVSATRSRLKKRALLCGALRAAGPNEVRLVVDYLSGILPQGRIGLGPAIVRKAFGAEAAADPGLSLSDVDVVLADIAGIRGKGSQQAREAALGNLFGRATSDERDFIARLLLGELRQGALEAVLTDAIAAATELDASAVRRAVMLSADPAAVAVAAFEHGAEGLAKFQLEPLSPVRPMLAQPAEDIEDAIGSLGEAALEFKLDGARVQVHRVGSDVRVFSRRLNDVTQSLPDVVEAVRSLPATSLILDGEVLALRPDGRPQPFQVTMRRFGRKTDIDAMRASLPMHAFFFDCLHADGDDLIDWPQRERFLALADATGQSMLIENTVSASEVEAGRFLASALQDGHEGIMAKSPDSLYMAGSRGADWLKIKQAHTLDLVVLAAEWGSGRREGLLSNLHLGARSPADSTFVMLGKTFKGLTDKTLRWQTEALLEREIGREGHIVHVRPELVAEIAVNEIQASPQYPAGMALRFARVKRYRDDKTAAEADTIETVRAIFERQAGGAE